MDLDDLLIPLLTFPARAFGWLFVNLFWWGRRPPHPNALFERGSYAAQSGPAKGYRIVYAIGEVVGTLLCLAGAGVVIWLIYAR